MGAAVAGCVLAASAPAQSLRLSSNQIVIGSPLQGSYRVPTGENAPRFSIGMRRKGQKNFYWTGRVPRNASGTMKLHPPNDPGEFEAVLFDASNVTHRVVSIRAVVTPTPGALSTDKKEHVVGAPISVRAEKRPNRFYGNGWVGLFKKGQNHPGGSTNGAGSTFLVLRDEADWRDPRDQSIAVSRAASSFFSTLPTPLLGRSSISIIFRGTL